jgi:hypothetical protein
MNQLGDPQSGQSVQLGARGENRRSRRSEGGDRRPDPRPSGHGVVQVGVHEMAAPRHDAPAAGPAETLHLMRAQAGGARLLERDDPVPLGRDPPHNIQGVHPVTLTNPGPPDTPLWTTRPGLWKTPDKHSLIMKLLPRHAEAAGKEIS